MALETAVATYGYPVLFFAAMLEGETGVVLAGFLAHRGYFELPWVVLTAWSAAYLSDQMFFHIGRRKGPAVLGRYPRAEPRIEGLRRFFDRHPFAVILAYRFMYGLQKLTPTFIGMSGFPPAKFAALTLLSSAAWAVVISSVGYFFGGALEALVKDVKRYELPVVMVILFLGVVLWLLRRRRFRPEGNSSNN